MVVDDIWANALNRHGRNDLKMRVFGFDCFMELRVSSVVTAGPVEEILVADLHVSQRKRLGMPVLRANSAPFRVRSTGYVRDLVECILHVRIEIRSGTYVLLRHRIAGVHRKDRLHPEIFAPLQKLQKTQPIRRVVAPRTGMRGPVHQGANRFLPFVPFGNMISLKVVSPGKTQESRMHGGQLLH